MSNKNFKRKALNDNQLENISGGITVSENSKMIRYNNKPYNLENLTDDEFNEVKWTLENLEKLQNHQQLDLETFREIVIIFNKYNISPS